MHSAITCLHRRTAGSPTRRGHRNGLAVLTAAALFATAWTGGSVALADDEKVEELTIWFAREYTVPSKEQMEAFTEKTGIKLKVDVQPDDNLFAQLIRMQRAGQKLPDVVHLDGFLRPVVAEAGVVVPIQDVVDQWKQEDPESFKQTYDANWQEGMWDGKLVGMANSASMEEVYFRKDWLAEAGVTGSPKTWDDVLDFARAIKKVKPDSVPFGWWGQRGAGANHVFASMTAMGVKFDGSVPNLKSEAGQYWINWVQTLAREGLASKDAIAWNDDNMRGGFIGSNIGMMLDSAPTALDAEEAGLKPGENFDLVPMPTSRTGNDQDGVITAPARTFFITADAEGRGAKDEAGLALRFLMQPDVALGLMLAGADPHRTAAVLEDQDALKQWVPAWKPDNVAAFSKLGVFPVDTDFPSSEDVMERFNEFVLSNPDMAPEAVAEEWQARFDAVRK